jgi:hypothetical protein
MTVIEETLYRNYKDLDYSRGYLDDENKLAVSNPENLTIKILSSKNSCYMHLIGSLAPLRNLALTEKFKKSGLTLTAWSLSVYMADAKERINAHMSSPETSKVNEFTLTPIFSESVLYTLKYNTDVQYMTHIFPNGVAQFEGGFLPMKKNIASHLDELRDYGRKAEFDMCTISAESVTLFIDAIIEDFTQKY